MNKDVFPTTRRGAVTMLAGLSASITGLSVATPSWAQGAMLARPIPQHPAESVPAVGVGTAVIFDIGSSLADRAGHTGVIKALVAGGGTLIDTAPSYGAAEGIVGNILQETGLRPRTFIATKLERYRPGQLVEEARGCMERLKTNKLDLLQLHNVREPGQTLKELNELKAQGICRYTGITTTFGGAYNAAEAIIKREKPEFIEIDYAIDNRDVEERILPAARDAGSAVMVALPFGRGGLFRKTAGKPLPEWAAEIDCKTWAQFFLKYLLGNPVVTVVIPGTDKADHMIDNMGAGHGRLPDAAMRARMVQHIESLG